MKWVNLLYGILAVSQLYVKDVCQKIMTRFSKGIDLKPFLQVQLWKQHHSLTVTCPVCDSSATS